MRRLLHNASSPPPCPIPSTDGSGILCVVMTTVTLIDERAVVTASELHALFPGERLCVCDFYVQGADGGEHVAGGYEIDGILNVDHHASTLRMWRPISSTHLAIAHVEKHGVLGSDVRVVIHHTDCDSVLSSGIMTGALDPAERFADAALAADHTGDENPIADLLQSLDDERDLDFSIRSLNRLERGLRMEERAARLLDIRRRQRDEVMELVSEGAFQWISLLAFAVLERKIESELVPSLLPDAELILLMSPFERDPSRWECKLRLGRAATWLAALGWLGIWAVDPAFGARWNAGSNKRGGGWAGDPLDYANAVATLWAKGRPDGPRRNDIRNPKPTGRGHRPTE